MNDQSKLMNPPPLPQMIGQPQRMNPPPPSQVMNAVQTRIMNQAPLLGQSQGLNHPIMGMNQQPQVMMNNQPMMMNPRNFNLNPSLSSEYQNQPNNFGSKHSKMSRNNWKGKKITSDKRPPQMMEPIRRMHNSGIPMYNPQQQLPGSGGIQVGPVGAGGYKPPTLNELQSQNRLKTRKFYPKKKYENRYVPYAPRNTTSFIIRAKKSGGIAELVSPCPVTPAVLPTPMFSPSREVLGDMAKEEWGVDGYGSMKGLIRLRSEGHELGPYDEDDEDEGGSSESDVEEHVEVERRLDHDLSRFEMIYPNYGGSEYNNVLENRVDDQDSHIAQLEEENLTLKERLFLMEREMGDLRRRLQYLERRNMVAEDANEEVVENESESDGDDTGGSDARTSGDTKENHVTAEDVCMQDVAAKDETVVKEIDDNKSNVDEAKENQHNFSVGISGENEPKGKEQAGKDFRQVSGEEANRVVVGMDQSKENEMAIEKLKGATENDSVGEQGTTI
uniref:PRLI-interacting factor A n=1 Tax=Noccaea caerulescens TaxID=107243 RepID=A0A1J3F872_NOCCA